MNCADNQAPDGPICPACGGERAPSGCDGGSWVHFDSKRPDRILMSTFHYGVMVKQVLANGVVFRRKGYRVP